MKLLKTLVGIAALVAAPVLAEDASGVQAASDDASEPVQVMVLGMYHFANPGLDVVKFNVDDVLAPKRQAEIANLVDSLAQWAPTKIAVENEAAPPTLALPDYAQTDALLATERSESVQIGFRLARQLGHEAVYGHDERGGEGEPDYFPMGEVQAFAEANEMMDELAAMFAEVESMTTEQQEQLARQSIAESLFAHNDGAALALMHDRLYYALLRFGDGNKQPGAELNAYWYMRNAKIFAKIAMVAQPGDRVLVLAGSGHATWLRHFAERVPGFELVEAMPYLERAAERSRVAAP
ncbi:hypothetical protein FHS52_002272 [Erythromicrobium ramosum]|uniref:TraB/GumN family protein n=1 Tax=Erythrobacter ramosus TaxID=35811 RepID=A0A6I4UMR3_9SPHN|nr:DUF5694 domain-containing protein [Erythrobacter ramosus]MBB3776303.1 hypothetical protein [Erythrobacter ramosus]MXP38615.1 hypothetical protein [Erythrobacter ramosus]